MHYRFENRIAARFAFCILIALAARARAADPRSDWPQWRGPTRDGVAPAGPKLLDRWSPRGPKLLWTSDTIPSGTSGGCGSVTVARGKAFVFCHWKHNRAAVIVTTKALNSLGWMEGISDDLAKKVDRMRGDDRYQRKSPAEKEVAIRQFMASLDPADVEKFGAVIEVRIRDRDLEWGGLKALAKVRDREFASWDALLQEMHDKQGTDLLWFPNDSAAWTRFRNDLLSQSQHYTDTVIALDAATGKQIWKKEFPGNIPTQDMMMYIGASSTPTVWEDKCYVTGTAGLYCLSVADGSVIWQDETKFSNSSPLIADGVLYDMVPRLTAFDAKTGKVIWTADEEIKSECASVVLWKSGGKDYLLGGNCDPHIMPSDRRPTYLFCVDPATGKKLWHTPGKIFTTPVIDGDILAVNDDYNARVYRITPEGATLLWTRETPDNRGASLMIYGHQVYSTAARYCPVPVRCFDLLTGAKNWTAVGDYGGNSEGSSPIVVEGKVIAQIKDPDAHPGGATTLMFTATPDNFEDLGQLYPKRDSWGGEGAATSTSPTVADGKLFLRLQHAIACWDITQHGPYLDTASANKDQVVFSFKQAEGGLSLKDADDGAIQGFWMTDGSGVSGPDKVRIEGSTVKVELTGAVFPVEINYASSGNLCAPSGPSAAFSWKSPRLQFQQCSGNTIVLTLNQPVDQEIWKSEATYSVSGAKVTKVETESSDRTVHLRTDRMWKPGEKVTIRYPALGTPAPDPTAELTFTAAPGRAVSDDYIRELLFGEAVAKVDMQKDFQQDELDLNTHPVAGEKWKFCRNISSGEFDLATCAGAVDLVHAGLYVFSETDRKVQLWLGNTGGFRVIVNGNLVLAHPEAHNWATPDFDKMKDVQLNKGWNVIMLGLLHRRAEWSIYLRIRDEQGGTPMGLRYMAGAGP